MAILAKPVDKVPVLRVNDKKNLKKRSIMPNHQENL